VTDNQGKKISSRRKNCRIRRLKPISFVAARGGEIFKGETRERIIRKLLFIIAREIEISWKKKKMSTRVADIARADEDRLTKPEGEPLLIFPECGSRSFLAQPGGHEGERVLQVARMVNITAKCKSYCYSRRAPHSPSLSLSLSVTGIKHSPGKTAWLYISFRGFPDWIRLLRFLAPQLIVCAR